MKSFEAWLEKVCSSEQIAPVLEQERNVVVTAGAGSGKTRTLVSRYLSLLLRYSDPRRVVAITFTDKAAEEMRARTRTSILELISEANDESDIKRLRELYGTLDAARIGTIHSLCMEILLDNPARAGIDPASTVLEEVQAGMLKLRVIKETLEEVSNDPRFDQVFININTNKAQKIFRFMLENRLKIKEVMSTLAPTTQLALDFFDRLFQDPILLTAITDLREYSDEELAEIKRQFDVGEILRCWDEANQASNEGDTIAATRLLFLLRHNHLRLSSSKKPAMNTLRQLRDAFDDPYAGELGFDGDAEFDPIDEHEYALVREGLLTIFDIINAKYEGALLLNQAIDFDSMEDQAVRLLRDHEIRANWQSKIDSLMVDEFQDTNERQREIVLSLTSDRPGKLFVVGDARQSIYRFRQADVSVFRRMLTETQQSVGSVMELSTSYRTHEKLLTAVGNTLAMIMGTEPDLEHEYRIHFTPLIARKLVPEKYTDSPYVEFVLTDINQGITPRDSMAYALAERLIRARQEGEIHSWGDVAILCRTTNSFAHYENAFDEAGIPFVTSSGKGFLTRPEVRDLLNVLRALAKPTDDLLMAGLLRSPMFGLSDAALYQLKPTNNAHYINQLSGNLAGLSETDAERARLTETRLRNLLSWVDRIPVSDLIKKVVDDTHYLAILAAANADSGSQRQWRNIEKLIDNARGSGMILLRDYLDLIDNYEDVGVDIGEAPAEAVDAVKLMTVHASKGLEFPWVVLGDAGRSKSPPIKQPVLFDKTTGLAFSTGRYSLHFQLSKQREEKESLAELDRLLYVALTRAKDKVIVNGVRKLDKYGILVSGTWLYDLSKALNDNLEGENPILHLGESVYSVFVTAPIDPPYWHGGTHKAQISAIGPDAMLLQNMIAEKTTAENELENTPRATKSAFHKSRDIVRMSEGSLAHKAIELDLDPDDANFCDFARGFIYDQGISDAEVIEDMIVRVQKLLRGYYAHPVAEAVRSAEKIYHELRYTLPAEGYAISGIIDLLVKLPDGWVILDFKTDMIRSEEEFKAALDTYRPQLQRYKAALYNVQRISAVPKICFLDDHGEVSIHTV